MEATKKPRKAKFPTGRSAFLRDICCAPKQIGACRIIGPSLRGPEWAIVEWTSSDFYNRPGDVAVVKLSDLDVR